MSVVVTIGMDVDVDWRVVVALQAIGEPELPYVARTVEVEATRTWK
jgi:hypothetical protein